MEIGGCYFASSVADVLDKDLLFCRKEDKKYNIKTCFAGNEPKPGSRVIIIDDVLSSGNTIVRGIDKLHAKGCEVYVICIFSYCWETEISKRLGVQVASLCDAEDLIAQGVKRGEMSQHNVQLIREYVVREEQRLVKPKNNDEEISKDE